MGQFLRVLGGLIAIAGILLGFALSLLVIYEIAGGVWLCVGLFTFPIVFVLTPLYTLVVYGSWHLLLINYGSVLATWVCYSIADMLEDEQAQTPRPQPVPPPKVEQTRSDNFAWSVIIWIFMALAVFGLFGIVTSFPQATRKLQTAINATKNELPRPTRTPQPISLLACVTDSTIHVRKGPGTNYETLAGLISGTCMVVLGRNEDSTWVYMASEDNKTGWVAASLLTVEGDLNRISVISASDVLDMTPTALSEE